MVSRTPTTCPECHQKVRDPNDPGKVWTFVAGVLLALFVVFVFMVVLMALPLLAAAGCWMDQHWGGHCIWNQL